MKRIALVLACFAVAVVSAASLSLNRSSWITLDGRASKTIKLQNVGTALVFNFPVFPTNTNTMNYLYNTHPPRSFVGMSTLRITMQALTTGAPTYIDFDPANVCPTGGTARPFFWANHNDWAEFSRWWSFDIAYDLTQGGFVVLYVPLDPSHWSSVYGKKAADPLYPEALVGFNQALANVSSLGLTFGRGCFFGHGLAVRDGTSQFQLIDFQVF